MTTMTIQVENSSVVASLKKILGLMEGVTIVNSTKRRIRTKEVPNDDTIAAMAEAESGKNSGDVNLESYESFVASMQ